MSDRYALSRSPLVVMLGCGSGSGCGSGTPAKQEAAGTRAVTNEGGGPGSDGSAAGSAAAAADADDCTLDRGAITGKLVHDAAGVKTIAAPPAAERHVSEAIELGDGTRIYFSLGGCAHFAWELVYEVPAKSVGVDAERRLDALEALLRRTPIADDLGTDMAGRIHGRARGATTARAATGPWELDCGDAICEAEAVVDGAVLRIKVGYDFPL